MSALPTDVDAWIERLPEWAQDPAFWSFVTAGSLVFSVGGLVFGIVALPWFLARVPSDYFLGGKHPLTTSRWVLFVRALRNVVGVILIALGVLLLVLPGPGYMTILAGVIVVNFSWKYRLGRWILRKRGIRPAVDRLRKKAGKPPLLLRDEELDEDLGRASSEAPANRDSGA